VNEQIGSAIILEGRTVDLNIEVEKFVLGRHYLRRWDGYAELPTRLSVPLVCEDGTSS